MGKLASGYVIVNGRHYNAEDVLYALMNQGIIVDVVENHSLRIANKVIDPVEPKDTPTEQSLQCPYLKDFIEVKDMLSFIKAQMSSNSSANYRSSQTQDCNSPSMTNTQPVNAQLNANFSYPKTKSDYDSKLSASSPQSNQYSNKFTKIKPALKENFDDLGGKRANFEYLARTSTCQYCSSKISPNTVYCNVCGKKVDNPTAIPS